MADKEEVVGMQSIFEIEASYSRKIQITRLITRIHSRSTRLRPRYRIKSWNQSQVFRFFSSISLPVLILSKAGVSKERRYCQYVSVGTSY